MSTRQLRLTSAEQIQKRIQEFHGKKINIVKSDRTVVLGTLVSSDRHGVEIMNMRQKRISISFNDVTELYFDLKE